jgi:hypothetical protein
MRNPQTKWRVNRHPRFTVLTLGEYMAADDGPRETILRGMKYERIARTLIYRHLYRAVSRFLVSPTHERGILAECRRALEDERSAASSPQQRENLTYEIRALEAFERSLNALGIGGLNFELARAASPLKIERVSISVQPTAHIRVKRPRGSDLIGAIVIDTAKGQTPRTDAARLKVLNGMTHSAVLLHEYVVREFPDGDPRPSTEHCLVFHAHRQDRVCAPNPYRRIYRNIEAVCRNIAVGWDAITPPLGFDQQFAEYRH